MPQDYGEIKRLFLQAQDLSNGDREDFLAGLDSEVQAEVRKLLAHEEDDFLSPLGGNLKEQLGAIPKFDPMLGQQVGLYTLERQIGTGGMGAVYLASRKGDYKQLVAIKLIRSDAPTSHEIIKRFRHERQFLAALKHPGIACLLDGGTTEDGAPYFIMEYVEGKPITKYCDEKKLKIEDRLKLFQKVCKAVQYCHQRGVIHRDLKPDNILITQEGEPKLVDFGIAKVTNVEASFLTSPTPTAPAYRFMTVEYASPEQVKGEPVSTLSDVYSLGVILYELLTGRRPLDVPPRVQREIERIICEVQPRNPSDVVTESLDVIKDDGTKGKADPRTTASLRQAAPDSLHRLLQGDIDTIALMALRKEPDRRDESVEEFADDIQRYFDDQPVTARPDSTAYRMRKFAKRNKVGVVAASIVAMATISAFVAVNDARLKKEVALRGKSEALERETRARTAAEQLRREADAINQELKKVLADALAGLRDSTALSWLVLLWSEGAQGRITRLNEMNEIVRVLNEDQQGDLLSLNKRLATEIGTTGIRLKPDEAYRSTFRNTYGDECAEFDFDSLYVNLFVRSPQLTVDEFSDYLAHYVLYWEDSKLGALRDLLVTLLADAPPRIFEPYSQALTDAHRSELTFVRATLDFFLDPSDETFAEMIKFQQFDEALVPGRRQSFLSSESYTGLQHSFKSLVRWGKKHSELDVKSFLVPQDFARPPQRMCLFVDHYRRYLIERYGQLHPSRYSEGMVFCKSVLTLEAEKALSRSLAEMPVDAQHQIWEQYPGHLVSQAKKASANGELKNAVALCNQAEISNGVLHYWAHILEIKTLRKRKDYEKAYLSAEELVRNWPHLKWSYWEKATCLWELGRWEEAAYEYTTSLETPDADDDAYLYRSTCFRELGAFRLAHADLKSYITKQGVDEPLLKQRANLMMAEGNWDSAIRDFSALIEIAPDDPAHRNSLAWVLSTCPSAADRNGTRAIEEATAACELTEWKEAWYFDTLAAAYAENSEFDKAVEFQNSILEKASPEWTTTDLSEFRVRLQLYEKNKPYREPLREIPVPSDRVLSELAAIQKTIAAHAPSHLAISTPERLMDSPSVSKLADERISKVVGTRDFADRLYDNLMRDIEPELLTHNIPNLDDMYTDETPSDRKARMARYEKAYAELNVRMDKFSNVIDETIFNLHFEIVKAFLRAGTWDQLMENKFAAESVDSWRSSYRLHLLDDRQELKTKIESLPGWKWVPE